MFKKLYFYSCVNLPDWYNLLYWIIDTNFSLEVTVLQLPVILPWTILVSSCVIYYVFIMPMQTKRTKKAGIVGKYGTCLINMTFPNLCVWSMKLTLQITMLQEPGMVLACVSKSRRWRYLSTPSTSVSSVGRYVTQVFCFLICYTASCLYVLSPVLECYEL